MTNKIVDIFKYIDDKTLVIFDVDNTLIETIQEFGSYAWFCSVTDRFQKKGYDYHHAMQKTCAIFEQIENLVEFKTVETVTLDVINQLQSKNIKTMALTMRSFSTKQMTSKQLASVDIKLAKNAVYDKKVEFDSMVGFADGVLYSGLKDNKGECLITFLEKINLYPANILFIDDSKHHIEEMHKILNAKGIPTNCILYEATHSRVAKFDPAHADRDLLKAIGKERFDSVFNEISAFVAVE